MAFSEHTPNYNLQNDKHFTTIEGKFVNLVADDVQPFRLAACNQFQYIQAHFEPERLPRKVRSCQRRGSRLQRHKSSDIDGSVEVPVHELYVFIAAGGMHHWEHRWNSCPLCRFSLGIVTSGERLFSSIASILLLGRCRRRQIPFFDR